MSDQTNAVGFTGEGQAGPPPEGTEATPTQQQYLTQKDFDLQVDGIIEQVVRRTQGLIDSQTSKINNRIQDGLNNLQQVIEIQRNSGMQITPEQEQALQQRVISEAYKGDPPNPPGPSETPGQQPPTGSPAGPDVDPVTAEAIAMMQEAGVIINNDDPEAEGLRTAKTPRQYFKAVEEGIRAKQARTSAGNTQPVSPGDPGDAPRMPTNVGGSGGSANLERQYREEVTKVRGDVWAVVQCKKKYRKMGLNI
jgi:hypothetical protein